MTAIISGIFYLLAIAFLFTVAFITAGSSNEAVEVFKTPAPRTDCIVQSHDTVLVKKKHNDYREATTVVGGAKSTLRHHNPGAELNLGTPNSQTVRTTTVFGVPIHSEVIESDTDAGAAPAFVQFGAI